MKNLGYLLGMALCAAFLKETSFSIIKTVSFEHALGLVTGFFLFGTGFFLCFYGLSQSILKAIFTYLEKFTK
jgi:hypothetical protein